MFRKSISTIIFVLNIFVIQAAEDNEFYQEYKKTQSLLYKVIKNYKEFVRIKNAKLKAPQLYHNVHMIYNDPNITRFSSYISKDNVFDPSSHRSITRLPSWDKKTEGSPVFVHGKPIYYKMYVPENTPVQAVLFYIYGGAVALGDFISLWYYPERVLPSEGYAIVQLSLSDVQGVDDEGKFFPFQCCYEPQHFRILMEEITTFIAEEFQKITAPKHEGVLNAMKLAPKFLMGQSFGGFMTLKCATDPDFLEDAKLDGFIARSSITYKYEYEFPFNVERYKDLPLEDLNPEFTLIGDVLNITAPVLLMHSQHDMRVPLDHSLRFYDAAKKLNKPVYLWVDEHDSKHIHLLPSDGTLQEAITRTNRDVAVIKKFIRQKRTGYSDQYYRKWHYAYPETNYSDIIGTGISIIIDHPDQLYYRRALKTLPKNATKNQIDSYLENNINPITMFSLLKDRSLYPMRSSNFNEVEKKISIHVDDCFSKDFILDIKSIDLSSNDCILNCIFKLIWDEIVKKENEELEKWKNEPVKYLFRFRKLQVQDSKRPLLKNDIATALLKIYTTYFYEEFSFDSSERFKESLFENSILKMKEKYGPVLYQIHHVDSQ